LAVVTLNGVDIYLGRHGTEESRAEYDRRIAEWLLNGRQSRPASQAASDLAVNELVVAYRKWADQYYRTPSGRPTIEPKNIRLATRPLLDLYGHSLAASFGPLALKCCRQRMIDGDVCRLEVNRRVGRIVRMFRWAVENELVAPSVLQGLRAIQPLHAGRSAARESEPVRPVPDWVVDATLPFLARQVAAMVGLQKLTGMRPGEVVAMRMCDLDMSGRTWVYAPPTHKTQHLGKQRHIFIGPKAQAVLRPWLRTDLTAPLFSPAEAMAERWERQRATRKTKVQPSQRSRKRPRPEKTPGECYTTTSYRRAIAEGVRKASRAAKRESPDAPDVPGWHPHQLRHNAATYLRREFGIEVARTVLGHSGLDATQIYAEADLEKARAAMDRVG
jgi:integrase